MNSLARATSGPAPAASRPLPRTIAVCGIDGSGKSTQAAELARRLSRQGRRATLIRLIDPATSDASLLFRHHDHLTTQSFCDAIAFSRRLEIRRVFENPAHATAEHLVFDRFAFTDLAYSTAHGVKLAFIRALLAETPRPDLTILLDVPVDLAMQRIVGRGDRWAFQEQPKVLSGARAAYLELAAAEGFAVVSGVGDPSDISDRLWAAVDGWSQRDAVAAVAAAIT